MRTRFATIFVLTSCFIYNGNSYSKEAFKEISIKKWARCNGVDDDWRATSLAFAAAASKGFTLVVDCPVRIHVGSDVARPIFIESGTRVIFREKGIFIIDNVFIPTWVIANASRIELTGWRVEYVGGLPVNPDTGGYLVNGSWKLKKGDYPAAGAFNDQTLTNWLSRHRSIKFGQGTYAIWPGPTNTSASFYIVGASSDIDIVDLDFFVAPRADPAAFAPAVFQASVGFKAGSVVEKGFTLSQANAAIPNRLRFRRIELDGTYMGWVGTMENAEIYGVRSRRYADLQGPSGIDVGGKGKWFAPPHLIYLTSLTYAPSFRSRKIMISHVVDEGGRRGIARDKLGDRPSGYAASLKLSADDTEVYDYVTSRPDGGIDIASSENLVIRKARISFSSSFLHGLYPAVRVQEGVFHRTKLSDIVITDRAVASGQGKIVLPEGSKRCGVTVSGVLFRGKLARHALTLPRACMN